MRISIPVRILLLTTAAGLVFVHRHDIDPRARVLSYAAVADGTSESHYRLDYRLRRTTDRPGASHESTVTASLGCIARPLEPTAEHAARFEVHYPEVDLRASELDVMASGDSLLERLEVPIASDFGYEVALSASGEIRSIKRTGERTAFPNARLYQERQNTFVSFLPHLFQPIAGGRKGPGSKWSSIRIEELQTAHGVVALLKTTAHYELGEFLEGGLARVRVRFQHAFAAADDKGSSVGKLRESGGEGELVFDLRRGRAVRYRADERAVLEVAGKGVDPLVIERVVSTRLDERDAPASMVMEQGGKERPVAEPRPSRTATDRRGLPLPDLV